MRENTIMRKTVIYELFLNEGFCMPLSNDNICSVCTFVCEKAHFGGFEEN